jgi:hypothetical protein
MKISKWTVIVLISLLCATGVQTNAEERSGRPSDEPWLGVGDVLDQIERVRRLTPENADVLRTGLQGAGHPLAELELALLEVYGPEPVRELDRGWNRLRTLTLPEDKPVDEHTRALLGLLELHALQLQASAGHRDRLLEALEAAREAHQETRRKLDALRRIEQQLDSADGNAGEPEPDGRR